MQNELFLLNCSRRNLKACLTKEYIIEAVTTALQISKEDLLGKSRKADFVNARVIVAYMLYTHEGLNHTEIAKELKKDRSTIYYYLECYENFQMNIPFLRQLEKVQLYINNG